jgi:hypothetical protein
MPKTVSLSQTSTLNVYDEHIQRHKHRSKMNVYAEHIQRHKHLR